MIPHVIAITQGDTETAPVHQCNVGMYSVNSHMLMKKNLHDIFCPTLPWQRGPNGN